MFVGPSPAVRSMLTMSLLESSALKFVPYIFLQEETVNEIVEAASLKEEITETDTSLIAIEEPTEEEKDLELIPVSAPTSKGYIMIIRDPSRVFVGIADNIHARGMYITELAEKYDAVAAINASGFSDAGGMSNGKDPLGLVVSEGKLISAGAPKYTAAAFDKDNILHVGKVTGAGVSTSTLNCIVTDRAVNGMPDSVSGNAMRLTCKPSATDVYIAQDVNARGAKGDVFTVSGWCNSLSVASGGTAVGKLPEVPGREAATENECGKEQGDQRLCTEEFQVSWILSGQERKRRLYPRIPKVAQESEGKAEASNKA